MYHTKKNILLNHPHNIHICMYIYIFTRNLLEIVTISFFFLACTNVYVYV